MALKFNIHAGHAKDGNAFCGTVGYIKESTEARNVKDAIIKYLTMGGAVAYDCTVDKGTTQTNVIDKIVAKANAHKVNLDVSIHFNDGRIDKTDDGKFGGYEIYAYSWNSSNKKHYATLICNKLKALGITPHGEALKTNKDLRYLRTTSNEAILIEVCFAKDKTDTNWYNKVGADKIGKSIAEALLGKDIEIVEDNKTYVITTDELNVRKSASASSSIVGVLSVNTKVEVLGEEMNGTTKWYKISNGYISAKYTKLV